MTTDDVNLGDYFVCVSPSGRETIYVVDRLNAETPQGLVMPRSVSGPGRTVYIHDELLAQPWWRPLEGSGVKDAGA